jgi:hypothetical protein
MNEEREASVAHTSVLAEVHPVTADFLIPTIFADRASAICRGRGSDLYVDYFNFVILIALSRAWHFGAQQS